MFLVQSVKYLFGKIKIWDGAQESFKSFMDAHVDRNMCIELDSKDKIYLVILKEGEYKFRTASQFQIIFLFKEEF